MSELNHPLYITIPYRIFADPNLSPLEKLILCEVVSLLRVETLFCFATNPHFQKLFGVSENTVIAAVKHLKARGYIGTLIFQDGCREEACPLSSRGWHRHIVPTGLLVTLSQELREAPSKTAGGSLKNRGTINTGTKNKEYARLQELKRTKNKSDLEMREYLALASRMDN